MSGESACPIIEAMLRAQIAETRHSDERGRGRGVEIYGREVENQPAENFSSGPRCSKLAEKVQAFRPFSANAVFILPFSHFSLFRFIRVLLFAVLYNMTREHLKFLRSTIVEIFDIVSILDSITGRIFKKKKKKIWILRIFDTTRRYDFREIKF